MKRVLLLSEVKSLKTFFDGKESIACSPCRELQKLKFDLRFLPHRYSGGEDRNVTFDVCLKEKSFLR